jgi:hypothetical protein
MPREKTRERERERERACASCPLVVTHPTRKPRARGAQTTQQRRTHRTQAPPHPMHTTKTHTRKRRTRMDPSCAAEKMTVPLLMTEGRESVRVTTPPLLPPTASGGTAAPARLALGGGLAKHDVIARMGAVCALMVSRWSYDSPSHTWAPRWEGGGGQHQTQGHTPHYLQRVWASAGTRLRKCGCAERVGPSACAWCRSAGAHACDVPAACRWSHPTRECGRCQ